MPVNSVLTPYPIFFDVSGLPLENGFIYIGQPGFEARSTPKASWFDITVNTIPTGTATGAAVRTRAGFPVNASGAPAMIYVDGDFSISVCDRNGVLLYSALSQTLAINLGGAVGPVLGSDGNLAAVGIGFASEVDTGFVRSAPGTMQTVVDGVLVAQQTVGGTVFQQPVSGAGFTSAVAAIAQPLDSDLTALAANSANGLWARTGAGAGAARTLTAGTDISVTNGDGVSGNPTVGYTGFSPKAWGNFNGTGTPTFRASGNCASITDNGTGDYTITMTNALADANFAIVVSGNSGNDDTVNSRNDWYVARPLSSSTFRIMVYDQSGVAIDAAVVSFAVFR